MPVIETNWIRLIGKHLRAESDDLTRDALPRRWVDLIRFLDERERNRDQAEARPQERPER